MNLQVLQENLAKAVTIASRFSSTRAQLPVLANILLSAKANKLIVAATNLETSISLSLGAKVQKEGEITVPAKTLTDLISNLNPGPLTLISEKEQLLIEVGGFSSNLMGVNSADYPKIPQTIDKVDWTLSEDLLSATLSQTLFAASLDETRPILTGMLFIFEKNKLSVVTTDGFRLSYKQNKIEYEGETRKFVLPRSILVEISHLLTEAGKLSLVYNEKENQVLFALESGIFSSRVLQGEYPDFAKIIPQSSRIKVNVDRVDFLKAVKLASVFARDAANVVKLAVKKDSLLLLAESQKSGSQKNKIAAKVEGGELDIAFNYHYLEEFLLSVKGESVEIELNEAGAPGKFTDPADKNYFHLVMPVKI